MYSVKGYSPSVYSRDGGGRGGAEGAGGRGGGGGCMGSSGRGGNTDCNGSLIDCFTGCFISRLNIGGGGGGGGVNNSAELGFILGIARMSGVTIDFWSDFA